jgi:hypothetical protein
MKARLAPVSAARKFEPRIELPRRMVVEHTSAIIFTLPKRTRIVADFVRLHDKVMRPGRCSP